ncbi:type II secretion system F family protein [Oceanicoccus sagamiensis]|uniref:MSHA biogenesis protein MshG n=1 Tax=Oceanicoccus sagamiensis TaxID=716816 RepID=A0A1X9N8T6_9GAMM|nr:type II secretion system F family protein [Oceanicoccus sagamiensis]ARN73591.1 MSHA biogenesis protein MshG [Oceanicoccus sagamiensis]
MAKFSYRGRDDKGELVSGVIDAGSADSVASQLAGNGVTPIAINENIVAKAIEMPDIFQQKVTLEELSMFCRQMYSLTRSGVVLNRAIRGLAESLRNERLTTVLLDVETSLNSGVNLSSALGKHPDIFDSLFVNIINVGESSGRLEVAFQQLSNYMELEKDTRRRISSAVRYPIFVLTAISIAIVVLNIFVIPVFADLFSKFGADLPWATRILIGTSNFFVEEWPLIIVFSLGSVIGIRYYINTEAGRFKLDRVKLRIPLIGSILERATLARFSRSFALMLNSGVPLIQALELSSQAVGNSYMAKNIRGMREGIQRGESLLRSALHSGMFTPLVLQMIQVGEETGQVDEMLNEVAEFYEQEVDYDLKNLSSYIEPILIACIAGLVMILALGIFLPMWDMMNVMQG